MKKMFFMLFAAALLASCDNAVNTSIDRVFDPLPIGVYIAGSCKGGFNQLGQACYWTGSRRIVLDGCTTDSITVLDGKVLVTGFFLKPLIDEDSSYFVLGIGGKEYHIIPCYWLDGTRYEGSYEITRKDENEFGGGITPDLPGNAYVYDSAVAGGKLWMVGYYINDQFVACYWVDGERHDLNGTTAKAIFVEE